jgi:tRNA-splicing ligase RtcB (3'-phosphate/5'-hydroxy nucleic acid ligase)
MSNLKKFGPATYLLPKEGKMKVPGLIFASDALIKTIDTDQSIDQVRNVACLPGIVGHSIAMPDIHWGYGFPIGGVAAMDINTGVISPGGVGYDINCGVRLAIVPETFSKMQDSVKQALLHRIFELVPSGVGHGHRGRKTLSDHDYHQLLEQGAKWSIKQGFGLEKDLDHMESNGTIEGASHQAVSHEAKARGKDQLGSIGSGNHFVEIGAVQKILQKDIAQHWGVEEGMTYLLIHSGSRGFGHQVCQDTLNTFIKMGYAENLPDRQLVAAPIKSEAGQLYFQAMAAAANFAFNNRQQILHAVRLAFKEICNIDPEEIRLLYDVCHNIAKIETHPFEGKEHTLCVHRKGATRAFGPGASELAPIFRKTGQPVLVPGDMGRASYLMVGCGHPLTWSSACHGAGRARSRVKSMAAWRGKDLKNYMEQQGVHVRASSFKTVAEEMPDAYKDVDIVVDAVQEAGLANKVARLKPSLVIKG